MESNFLDQLSELILSSSKHTISDKTRLSESEILSVIKDLQFKCNKETELTKSFEKTINSLNDCIWSFSLETFNYDFINKNAEIIFECTLEEFAKEPILWQNLAHPEDKQIVDSAQEKLMEKGELKYEYRIVTPIRKQIKWLSVNMVLEYTPDGKPWKINGITSDITNLKQKEIDLEFIQNLAKIGNWYFNLLDYSVKWSEETYKIFEFPKDTPCEKLYELYLESIHPEDLAELQQNIANCMEHGEPYNFTHRIITKSNSVKYLRSIGEVHRDNNGTPIGMSGIAQDITNQFNTRLNFEHIQELAKIGTWNFNLLNYDLEWSKQHYKIFEIDSEIPKDKLYETYRSKILEEDIEELDRVVDQAIKEKKGFIYKHRIKSKNGEIKYLEGNGKVLLNNNGEAISVQGTVQDMTEIREQQEELKTTTENLEAILNATEFSMISTDLDGIITNINAGGMKMLGYEKEELVGKTTPAIIHDLEEVVERSSVLSEEFGITIEPGFETFVFKARTLKTTDSNEWTYIRKDGSKLPVNLSASCIYDTNQNVVGYLGIARDITRKKLIEAEKIKREKELLQIKAELENFFTLTNDFMCIANTDGTFKTVNPTFVNELGYNYDELINKPFVTFIHPEDIEPTFKVVETLAQGKILIDFENRYIKKDGSYIWISWRAAPDVQTGNLYATGRDVTEHKKSVEIYNQNILLQKEKELVVQKSKLKEQFLANMSHEIRTPMNSILGLSNLMEKVGDLNPKQSDYLKTIKINSKNLLGIINDILDLSKIEEGKLEIEESSFNLKDLIHALVKSLNLIAHKKKIELKEIFDASLPEFLLGDSVRLNQVLLNLTNNAIKFTNEGSVSIELSKLDETDDSIQIYFAIKDTGIGIHPEKIDTIFEPFTQETSSTTRLFGGTGLGLTISSKIIRALGGQINVTSEIEVGSTFSFILTLKKDTSKITIETTPSENIELFGKYKILLVEDNPFNQMVAEDTLKEWNGELEIDIIDNGKDAIQQLKENTYDLVLLDIQMPEMDGHEVCRIARNELKITTPILAMTAQATQKEIETCFLNGMNDYISKPFEEKTLFSKIVNWIK